MSADHLKDFTVAVMNARYEASIEGLFSLSTSAMQQRMSFLQDSLPISDLFQWNPLDANLQDLIEIHWTGTFGTEPAIQFCRFDCDTLRASVTFCLNHENIQDTIFETVVAPVSICVILELDMDQWRYQDMVLLNNCTKSAYHNDSRVWHSSIEEANAHYHCLIRSFSRRSSDLSRRMASFDETDEFTPELLRDGVDLDGLQGYKFEDSLLTENEPELVRTPEEMPRQIENEDSDAEFWNMLNEKSIDKNSGSSHLATPPLTCQDDGFIGALHEEKAMSITFDFARIDLLEKLHALYQQATEMGVDVHEWFQLAELATHWTTNL